MPLYNPSGGSVPNTLQTDNIIGADTTVVAGFSAIVSQELEISDGFAFEVADTAILEVT